MHTPSSRSKGEDGLSCEITRTCNPSVPGIADSHEFAIHLTTGTFNLLSKTKSAIRLSGAFQSNLSAFALSVLETFGLKGSAVSRSTLVRRRRTHPCRPSQSIQTTEDEPFKSTAAVLDVSTCSVEFPARMLTSMMLTTASLQTTSHLSKTAAKRSCSEVVATCKTLQSRLPLIRVIALNHPALAPGCLIGLLSDVQGTLRIQLFAALCLARPG